MRNVGVRLIWPDDDLGDPRPSPDQQIRQLRGELQRRQVLAAVERAVWLAVGASALVWLATLA